jgi:hypothetical protein
MPRGSPCNAEVCNHAWSPYHSLEWQPRASQTQPCARSPHRMGSSRPGRRFRKSKISKCSPASRVTDGTIMPAPLVRAAVESRARCQRRTAASCYPTTPATRGRSVAGAGGACPDAADWGIEERFSHQLSSAPTAPISIIAGNSSPGIEPIAANVFLQKMLSGSHSVRNWHLKKLLAEKGQDTDEVWSSITLTDRFRRSERALRRRTNGTWEKICTAPQFYGWHSPATGSLGLGVSEWRSR